MSIWILFEKLFSWQRVTVACPSGSRNSKKKKISNYGGLLNLCEFVQTEKIVLKQVRYFKKELPER